MIRFSVCVCVCVCLHQLSLWKISQWQLANVVSHCLVTYINTETHTFTRSAWQKAMSLLHSVLLVLVDVWVRVCVGVCDTRWGSDPLSQYHANTSSLCAPWQLLCVQYRVLVRLFSRTHSHTHSVLLYNAHIDTTIYTLTLPSEKDTMAN